MVAEDMGEFWLAVRARANAKFLDQTIDFLDAPSETWGLYVGWR
jgi:hypothetical protein